MGVTGVNGKTTTTRLVAHIVACTGKVVGMTCTDGIYVNNRRIDTGDCSGPQSAKAILLNPSVEAGVFETARGGMLREGLVSDRMRCCNRHQHRRRGPSGDQRHQYQRAIGGSQTDIGRGSCVRLVPRFSKPTILWLQAWPNKCPGSVVFFAIDGNHELLISKRKSGGRVAFVRDQSIVLADGDHEIRLLSLNRIP